MKKKICTLALLLYSVAIWAHPIKMSTGRMEIDSKTNTVSILINFFIDDFEASILSFYPQPSFDFDNINAEMIFSINDYIQKNLIIKTDSCTIKYQLTSLKKSKENVCQVTFNGGSDKLSTSKTLIIQNTLLFDVFEKQSNILHLKTDSEKTKILEFYPKGAVKKITK